MYMNCMSGFKTGFFYRSRSTGHSYRAVASPTHVFVPSREIKTAVRASTLWARHMDYTRRGQEPGANRVYDETKKNYEATWDTGNQTVEGSIAFYF